MTETARRIGDKRFFDWDTLDQLSKTPLSAIGIYATIIIPLFGIFLSTLKGLFFVRLLEHYPSILELRIPLSMLIAYLSALLFSISTVIVLLLCPADIRKHETYKAYHAFLVESGNEIFGMRNVIQNLEKDEQKDASEALEISDLNRSLIERFIHEIAKEEATKSLVENHSRIISNSASSWASKLKAKPKTRYFTGTLYAVSLLLSAYIFFIYMPTLIFSLT
ncbi:hypothetical protein V1T76_28610 [Roseibium sp. FZY0029]|uniref:hypothetical protein n=1 Tax=Roseibium sp. FZY0029 TaxID=3116647 RepID=UPI002EB46A99|nr:hypothetical protein [Roseibium sp. FZY0029]